LIYYLFFICVIRCKQGLCVSPLSANVMMVTLLVAAVATRTSKIVKMAFCPFATKWYITLCN